MKKEKSLTAPQRLVAAQLQDQKWDFNGRWMMKEEWSKQITAAARRLDLRPLTTSPHSQCTADKGRKFLLFSSNTDDEPSVLILQHRDMSKHNLAYI